MITKSTKNTKTFWLKFFVGIVSFVGIVLISWV